MRESRDTSSCLNQLGWGMWRERLHFILTIECIGLTVAPVQACMKSGKSSMEIFLCQCQLAQIFQQN